MANLYLLRHAQAQSAWGSEPDPGLSSLGKAQAIKSAAHFAYPQPQALISSPKRRALETAQPFAKKWNMDVPQVSAVTELPAEIDGQMSPSAWLEAFAVSTWSVTPAPIKAWRLQLWHYIQSTEVDTLIITHFMAINAVVTEVLQTDSVVHFFPDHLSVTHLKVTQAGVKLIRLGAEKRSQILL